MVIIFLAIRWSRKQILLRKEPPLAGSWRVEAARILRPENNTNFSRVRPVALSLDRSLHILASPSNKGHQITFYIENAFHRKVLYMVADYYRYSKMTQSIPPSDTDRYRASICSCCGEAAGGVRVEVKKIVLTNTGTCSRHRPPLQLLWTKLRNRGSSVINPIPTLQPRVGSTWMPWTSSRSLPPLPVDLLVVIFSHLELLDLGRVARVSQPWYRASQSPLLWKLIGAKASRALSETDPIPACQLQSRDQVLSYFFVLRRPGGGGGGGGGGKKGAPSPPPKWTPGPGFCQTCPGLFRHTHSVIGGSGGGGGGRRSGGSEK